ncbi:uncharacterized protein LOC143283731 [Babylonia areolata]|uniref:uncharacterized protein LOC143283731 n=1 Tax=Babylonia areolata TaxID=304850 RepID=UPI003FD358DA
MTGFLRRHPNIVPRKTEQLSSARARAADPYIIMAWFDLLEKELTKAGVATFPEQIFNVDESGFVTDPKSDIVLAEKGARRVNQAIGGSGREQVTVNCAGSAAGLVLPPYVIYKGKNLYHEWMQGGPQGTRYNTSENGWMEGPLFLDWFQNIFLKSTEHLSNKARVLICDGHMSHLTLALINAAKENNVFILRLPAHLTHLLQPLDRAVFRPVKQVWQLLLRDYARTHCGPVSKKAFPGLLNKLFAKSFKSEQLKAGFRACGIFPLSKEAIPAAHLEPTPFVMSAAPSVSTSAAPSPTATSTTASAAASMSATVSASPSHTVTSVSESTARSP